MSTSITLYGAARCRKTQHYMRFLTERELDFAFLDVEKDENAAEALRGLYPNRNLHFPTLTIGAKRLRNPKDRDLQKWLDRLA